MNNPPSAVNPWKLQAAMPPDNSRSAGMLAAVGTSIGEKFQGYKKQKLADSMRDELLGVDGDKDNAILEDLLSRPEDEQNRLAAEYATTKQAQAKQRQIGEAAEKERAGIRQDSRKMDIVKNPARSKLWLEYAELDPKGAANLMDLFTAEDEAQKAALTEQANQAGVYYQTLMNSIQAGDEGTIKHLVQQKFQEVSESGGNTDILEQIYTASMDERGSIVTNQLVKLGKVVEIAEQENAITLADGAELRDPKTGKLIARNEKEEGITPYQQEQIRLRQEENNILRDDLSIKQGEKTEKQNIEKQKVLNAISYTKDNANRVVGLVDEALKLATPGNTGITGAALAKVNPQSEAAELQRLVSQIKSNLGLDNVINLKKQGGTLGPVSERELAALESTIANLEGAQGHQEISKGLGRVKTHYRRLEAALEKESIMFGGAPSAPKVYNPATDEFE